MKYDHPFVEVNTPYEQHKALARQQKVWITSAKTECSYDSRQANHFKNIKNELTPEQQHTMVAEFQKNWANNAKRDADYLLSQSQRFKKEGKRILEHGYRKEYEWSMFWYHKRLAIAKEHTKLAKFDHKDRLVLYKVYMQEHNWCMEWIKRRENLIDHHTEKSKQKR